MAGHEAEQALGDGEGQESLACCSPWGHKESDLTERLNNSNNIPLYIYISIYTWVSLVAQMVKNQPAMWETWARSLGWEDPLEEGMATYSSILAWKIPMNRGDW